MDFRWIIFITLIVLGLILFIWTQRHRFYSWVFSFRNHRQLGEPCPTDIIIDREGYSLGFSQDKKSALWVAYIISKNSIGIDVDRGDRFYPDLEEQQTGYRFLTHLTQAERRIKKQLDLAWWQSS